MQDLEYHTGYHMRRHSSKPASRPRLYRLLVRHERQDAPAERNLWASTSTGVRGACAGRLRLRQIVPALIFKQSVQNIVRVGYITQIK